MTPNPWPEDSDYGKLWRKGYQAGKSDAQGRMLATIQRVFATPTPGKLDDERR